MTVGAKVIADSVSSQGIRIVTLQVTAHRFVLPEINTHRVFSRNFRSSRAVPVSKMIDEVRSNPAVPVAWQANRPGMQGGGQLPTKSAEEARREWIRAAHDAADHAQRLLQMGLHKSWSNRVLEPFLFVHGVVTSTEWDNFFALRIHDDAQPEIRLLAECMREALKASTPKLLDPGEWHLPYITDDDRLRIAQEMREDGEEYRRAYARPPQSEWEWCGPGTARRVSAARCARVSYKTHGGKDPTIAEDLALYERLVGAQPIHASPTEHQATPDRKVVRHGQLVWERPELHGNFRGWIQHRKIIPGECA